MNKKILFILFVFVTVLLLPNIMNAQTSVGLRPFGGQVIMTEMCNDGMLLTLKTFSGTGQYFWRYGNLPYLMHTVPHTGQYMLGMASYAPYSCFLGIEYVGIGYPIMFHGSGM